MQNLIRQLQTYSKIIVSCDLDNTLVDRARGANYISPELRAALLDIYRSERITLLPNTGRDQWAFAAFCSENIPLTNAVLGNGSLLLIDGNISFNENAMLEDDCIRIFIKAVEEGVLPFIDISSLETRAIISRENSAYPPELLFAQNPPEWRPYIKFIIEKPTDIQPYARQAFRIEFPIHKSQASLYKAVDTKSPRALSELVSLLKTDPRILSRYSLHKKAFFNENYKKQFVFVRVQKQETFSNKGTGLKAWTEQAHIAMHGTCILHIGDKISGMVNDALVQEHFEHSFTLIINPEERVSEKEDITYIKGNPQLVLPDLLRALM